MFGLTLRLRRSFSLPLSLLQFVTSAELVGRESGLADFSRARAAKFLPVGIVFVRERGVSRPRCDVVTFSPSPRSGARLFSFGNRAARGLETLEGREP